MPESNSNAVSSGREDARSSASAASVVSLNDVSVMRFTYSPVYYSPLVLLLREGAHMRALHTRHRHHSDVLPPSRVVSVGGR